MTDRIIVLLRHGEVQGGGRFRGSCDDALSDAGWVQMRAAAAREPDLERILSSPARRCADFARALAAQRGLPVELSEALRERHFGDWEGRAAEQIPAAQLARFWDDPVGYTPPGAEPFADFRQRVLDGWQALCAQAAPHTLVLTHGGPLRIILAEVLAMSDCSGIQLEVPSACVTRVRLPAPPGRPSLISHAAGPD